MRFSRSVGLGGFIDFLKESSDEQTEKELGDLYDKGFLSFRPIVNSEDEIRVSKISEQIKGHIFNSEFSASARRLGVSEEQIIENYYDDAEELIADDEFASLLNGNGEIFVGDSIYRYTPTGAYIVHHTELKHLYEYLESDEFKEETGSRTAKRPPETGYVPVTEYVTRYAPVLPIGGSGGGGGSNSGSTGGSSSVGMSAKEKAIAALKTCDYKPNVLNKIFGPSETCISHWSSSYRIKTKSSNQNYGLWSSISVKTKSQRRKFRIWWQNKADELELGIDLLTFSSEGYTKALQKNFNERLAGFNNYAYEYEGAMFDDNGRVMSSGPVTRKLFKNLPIPELESRKLKIFVKNKKLQDVLARLSKEYERDGSLVQNSLGDVLDKIIEQAWSKVRSEFRSASKDQSVMIVGMDAEEDKVYFCYKNYRTNRANYRNIQKRYNFNTAIVSYDFLGRSFDLVSPAKSAEDFSAKIYGIGRRGSTWKGGKIVLN